MTCGPYCDGEQHYEPDAGVNSWAAVRLCPEPDVATCGAPCAPVPSPTNSRAVTGPDSTSTGKRESTA